MSILSWLPWMVSGGTITWILLAIFAPSVLQIVTPILRAIIDGLIEYVRILWNGFTRVLDSSNSIIFFVSACVACFIYGQSYETGKRTYDKPARTISQKAGDFTRSLAPARKDTGSSPRRSRDTKEDFPLIKIPGWSR